MRLALFFLFGGWLISATFSGSFIDDEHEPAVEFDYVTASHKVFWLRPAFELAAFFSDLDWLVARMRHDRSGRFRNYIPFVGDYLSESVAKAINNLDMARIEDILAEGNDFVIDGILERGFRYSFTEWERIRLDLLPPALLPEFPIEYLAKEAFSVLNTDSVVDCLLARAEGGRLKNFGLLIPKLDGEFWKLPRIRANRELKMRMSAFHLGDLMQFMTDSETSNLEDLFEAPYGDFAKNLVEFEYRDLLMGADPIITDDYDTIARQLGLYFNTLQTFLHESTLGDLFNNSKLIDVIVEKSVELQEIIGNRMVSHPSELEGLSALLEIFKLNFSAEINPADFEGFFAKNETIEFAGLKGILKVLSEEGSIDSLSPDATLSAFLMVVKDDECEEDVEEFIGLFSDKISSHRESLKPFENNQNLVRSFGNCLNRNRQATERVISSFNRSTLANRRDIDTVAGILEADHGNLRAMLLDGGLDGMRRLRFSTIFAGAFLEDSDYSPSPSSSSTSPNSTSTSTTATSGGYRTLGSLMLKQYVGGNKKKKTVTFDDSQEDESGEVERVLERDVDENDTIFFELDDIYYSGRASRQEANSFVVSDTFFTEVNSEIDEYVHVNYLFAANERRRLSCSTERTGVIPAAAEKPLELKFIKEMLFVLSETMRYPASKPMITIRGSNVGGSGLLTDSLALFGRLLSFPRLKTLEFKEELDGFIPLPLLYPKLMPYLGAWMALCLKYEVPLLWSFAPVFRKFLFTEENDSPDRLIDVMYHDLLTSIEYRFESGDYEDIRMLPCSFTSNRMFELPDCPNRPVPFLFENRFLQMVDESRGTRTDSGRRLFNRDSYMTCLKFSIRMHLLEGRAEFQRGFRLFFKDSALRFLQHEYIDEFICGRRASVDEVSNALLFYPSERDLQLVDDFEDSDGSCATMTPLEFMQMALKRLTPDQLGKFLWFVTGSSGTVLNGFEGNQKIGFKAVEASPRDIFCHAQVCNKQFTLVVHGRSAQETFDKFMESICNSTGFALHE